MNEKTNFFVGILFIVILVCTGFTETHLKSAPQIIMFIFGAFTLFSLFKINHKISKWIFYLFFGVFFFITFFWLTNLFLEMINPNKGLAGGHRVMDMSWIWIAPFSLVVAACIIFLYHKKKLRSKQLEIGFVSLFLAVTAIIYLVTEVF